VIEKRLYFLEALFDSKSIEVERGQIEINFLIAHQLRDQFSC